ncbi:MAG: DUF5329 family protein [Pseudomonadota bacterium]
MGTAMKGAARALAALALAATLGTPPPARAAPPPHEQQRIEQLLDALAADSRSRFVRNGTAYSGADAARFLRAKLRAQGQDIAGADAFIERIASRSGTTGQPYRVCTPGSECVDAGAHLRALLAALPPARPGHLAR